MKYVMLYVDKPVKKFFPVMFPDGLVHQEMVEAMKMWVSGLEEAKAVSAGEVRFTTNGVRCSGKSETLGLKSDSVRDSAIINTYSYLHGIAP